MRLLNQIIVCGAALLLTASVWPGYAGGCWVLPACAAVAVAGVAWVVLAAKALARVPPDRGLFRPLLVAPVVTALTFVLLLYYVPRRIAFAACRPAFDAARAKPSFDAGDDGTELVWLGVYRISAIATDPRGGTYFRTGSGPDGIGPDRRSFGFAHQPNPTGTPFGRAGLQLRRLSQDWHWFTVSDDFH
jgi:hypothetical protein